MHNAPFDSNAGRRTMGRRSERLRIRKTDAQVTKTFNRVHKTRERARRDARMIQTINAGSLPYTPDVMSWLSVRLDKKSSRITDVDLKTLLKT